MKYVDTINRLASRFERKLVLAQQTEQNLEAPDFFFGKGYNLKTFQQALGNLSIEDNKAVGSAGLAKALADFWNKHQQNASVTVSCAVKPGVSAQWLVRITPQSFVATAMAELNKAYQGVTGRTWGQGQADADKTAKQAKGVEGDMTRQIVDMGV